MVGMGLEDTLNEVEVAYFMSEKYQHRGYTKKAVTIDCTNTPSCKLADNCGFELFEKRTSIGHIQPNMGSDSYYYYRIYRKG